MRIIGTVPVYEDGSAVFRVPANTPLCVQPLDKQGKAVQLMRSWFTAMPGEVVSCVGCHEQPRQIPGTYQRAAATRSPDVIEPWHGPPRGLDFERDVQPVLDKYCVACHDGGPGRDARKIPDLRSQRHVKSYRGRPLTNLGATRLHPAVREALGGTSVRYTAAYEALIPYIRRVNVEDHVGLLVPAEYHADTSELIQILSKGHHNVRLDDEAWDRLITWIDLNAPCHGTWRDVAPIPDGADRRRQELSRLYGGPADDPEHIPDIPHASVVPIMPEPVSAQRLKFPSASDWPFDARQARLRQMAAGVSERIVDFGGGVAMKLVGIPAGRFVMGDSKGQADECPPWPVRIGEDFWIGACEVTNEQYRLFDPDHDSGYFTKRFQGPDGPGLLLNGPKQPVVRVSLEQALAFCRWLSQKTGMKFTLPTEAQWEYACRAGTATAFSYGNHATDFSQHANMADKALSVPPRPTGGLESNITAHFGRGIFLSAIRGGNIICDTRFDDGAVATADVGSYRPNAWGLFDMHGNACEWTRTTYKPYPYRSDDGRDEIAEPSRKVVRGGAWCDRPKGCRSAFRLSYPPWQRVHNVGFRVVCKMESASERTVASAKAAQGTRFEDTSRR
jgi:formylglycine-generating enzyme required for sulfatase activity